MNDIMLVAAGKNISGIVTEISTEDALGTLGASMHFSLPWGDRIAYNLTPPGLGDPVTLYKGGHAVYNGVITAEDVSQDRRSYTCHDFCWYLNKSKITIQFDGITVAAAIMATLGEVGINARIMPDMHAEVEATCYCETPAAILQKLLERQSDTDGEDYHIYASKMVEKSLHVEKVGAVKPGTVLQQITSPSRSETLDGMVNRVEYMTGDSSGYYHTGIFAENTESVKRYGMIQDIIIAGDEDKDAQTIVNTRVERKSEPIPRVNVECKGDFNLRAGVTVYASAPIVGVAGDYIVEQVNNNIAGGTHRMTVTLRGASKARGYAQTVVEDVKKNGILILHNKEGDKFHVRD